MNYETFNAEEANKLVEWAKGYELRYVLNKIQESAKNGNKSLSLYGGLKQETIQILKERKFNPIRHENSSLHAEKWTFSW